MGAGQRYLQLLGSSVEGIRLNVISAQLNLPKQTVQRLIEMPLLEDGYIEKTQTGLRVMTEKGRKHVEQVVAERAD